MAGEHRFHSVLKDRVKEQLDLQSASLANGTAKDYPDYRQQVGRFIGLQDALKIAEEIEREFDQR